MTLGIPRANFALALAILVSLQATAATLPTEAFQILEKNCFKCHGAEKQKGGLRFDREEEAFNKGDSGEVAIVRGHAKDSLLIKLVTSKDDAEWMPPKGDRLSSAQIDTLKRWIDAGAEWPSSAAATTKATKIEMVVTDEDRQHWSFRELKSPKPPKIQNAKMVRTVIDQFVIAKLDAAKIQLSSEASARKLVRRIYFDLIGFPPTPAQVEKFVEQHARDPQSAPAALVDELLASPQYGERWARHWLDVARYADSDGSEGDADRPTAFHYRDFVIRSLNDDLPFNTFVQWQLAGDELEPDNPRAIAATGFIAAGTHAALPDNLMEEERIRTRFNELDDMIATTGTAMLGLTIGCARCHDHKYDPLPRRDYYRMLSAFNGGDRAEAPLVPQDEVHRYREADAKWKTEFESAKKKFDTARKAANKAHDKEARQKQIDTLKISDEEKAFLKNNPDDTRAKDLARKFEKELKVEDFKPFYTADETKTVAALETELKSIESRKPKALPTAFGFADFGPKPRETFLLARGDFRAKSEPVQIGFLTALTRGKSAEDYFTAAQLNRRRADSTQQRLAMAEWIADLDHGSGALVARVIVNRVWMHHFGQGLVRTVNDFGARSDPPTHPELLEWLASEFVKSGWKLKPLHRLIMTSAVYLQDNSHDEAKSKIDPENRLLWRKRPQRIEAEILRDAMLTVSGAINPAMFGPAIKAPIPAEAIQARNMKDPYPKDIKESPATLRRSIYIFHKRVVQNPLMQAFDGPDAQASCGRRENTTVAPQALALLNDRFVRNRAKEFAQRLRTEAGSDRQTQINLAWQLAFGRNPNPSESTTANEFLTVETQTRATRKEAQAYVLALTDFCQALFAMNEFIYVD